MYRIWADRWRDIRDRIDRCQTFPRKLIKAAPYRSDNHFCGNANAISHRALICVRGWTLNTYVHWHGISPLKLEFFVSLHVSPSAAMHHTFATLSLVQSYGCCVLMSMWLMFGSGQMYWPILSLLQSTSTATSWCAWVSSIMVVIAMQWNDEIAIAHNLWDQHYIRHKSINWIPLISLIYHFSFAFRSI